MSEPEAYQYPHYAQINFHIDVFKVMPDGSLDPKKMSKRELEKYGIAETAIFGIEGFDKADCIKKVKEVLGGLRYE